MVLSQKIKLFLKTGKMNSNEIIKEYFLKDKINKKNQREIKGLLDHLSEQDQEKLVKEIWSKLSPKKQKDFVSLLYCENWEKLLNDYSGLCEEEQILILEILAYIPQKEVVLFLVDQLRNKKESISLTAGTALKKQDSTLTFEPLFKALIQPEVWLPSRVFQVLRENGSRLIEPLLEMVEETDLETKEVIVQILGEIGDTTCLPILEKLAQSEEKRLRKKASEALKQLSFKESWPILIKLLDDSEWPIRLLATETLGKMGIREALPFLKERKTKENDMLIRDCIDEAIREIEEFWMPMAVSWVRER